MTVKLMVKEKKRKSLAIGVFLKVHLSFESQRCFLMLFVFFCVAGKLCNMIFISFIWAVIILNEHHID